MVNGRLKGNRFENDVCVALSRWLVPSLPVNVRLDACPFRRRTTSIAPVDGHWNGRGDILHRPDLPFPWPFCVEAKNQEGWTLDGLLSNPRWIVRRWWTQTVGQATDVSLRPLLVFARKHYAALVMLEEVVAQCLKLLTKPGVIVTRLEENHPPVVVARLLDLVASNPSALSDVSGLTVSRRLSRSAAGSANKSRGRRGSRSSTA